MLFLNLLLSTLAAVESPAPNPVLSPPTPAPLAQDAEEAETPEGWTGALTLGASATGGNTDIKRASATADAVKEAGKNRYTLGMTWNYSKEEGELTQRRTYAKGQYDRLINERLYFFGNGSYEADETAGLDLRSTIGAGVGYQFKDTEKFKLSGELGLAYLDEDYTDDDADKAYLAAQVGYKWDYIHSERWSFDQRATIYPSLEDSDDVYSKAITRAKAALTENMFAQLEWQFDWNSSPPADNKKVDNLYLLTIGWKF